MKIKIKQLFDEITKQKVYPLTTIKAVRDPSTKKSLAELLLVGEDVGETQNTPTKDADTLGGKYRASDIDKSMTYDEDESTEVIEGVEIVDADKLGGRYTANDIDAIKQDINGLNSSLITKIDISNLYLLSGTTENADTTYITLPDGFTKSNTLIICAYIMESNECFPTNGPSTYTVQYYMFSDENTLRLEHRLSQQKNAPYKFLLLKLD